MSRIYNFSAGPAVLPEPVLEEARDQLLDFQGAGLSIMEASHRGKEYSAVHEEAIANIKQLLDIPAGYSVLFMTGGASTQFSLAPMNLRGEGQSADYVNTGAWAAKAVKEAKLLGAVNVVADTSKASPARMPTSEELVFSSAAAYVHVTSNETIGGIQMKTFPETDAPLVCDMSSDILSRPLDVSKFGLIYAGAQKNLGPAGVTIAIIRDELADRAPASIPALFKYKTFIENNSLSNTAPTFPIYMVMLVTRWILGQGGLAGIEKRNEAKAGRLYSAIDASPFYKGTAAVEDRSLMNVTFRLPSEDLEKTFITEAAAKGLSGLKGHRSVGGVRASIYNAFPEKGVGALIAFMQEFEKSH